MINTPFLPLNDGRQIPQLGLGVWRTPVQDTEAVVSEALRLGYRAVDTASLYGNEAGVGAAVRAASGGRNGVFVTTKLWNDRQGFAEADRAMDESLERLGLDAVDLYLIHWPAPSRGLFVETWRALIRMRQDGRARSIGVSNFAREHLIRLMEETGVAPCVNQIELHPRFQQRDLRDFHAGHGILTQSWRPLGKGALLDDPVLGGIARKHGRTPAQVVIRWHVDNGLLTIPKSVHADRLRENLDVFGFALDGDDLAAVAAMDSPDGRMGSDPLTFA